MNKELKKILKLFERSKTTKKYRERLANYLAENRVSEDKLEIINWAKWVCSTPDKYIILDTETTGLHNAEIVQIAVINLEGETLLNTLVKPSVTIPYEVTSIHGIDDNMVRYAPTFPDIYQQLKNVLFGKTIIIYNSDFDKKIIKYCCQIHNLETIFLDAACLMVKYAQYIGEWSYYYKNYRWQKLPDAEHTALNDCLATLKLIKKIANTKIYSQAELTESFDKYWFNKKLIDAIDLAQWEEVF